MNSKKTYTLNISKTGDDNVSTQNMSVTSSNPGDITDILRKFDALEAGDAPMEPTVSMEPEVSLAPAPKMGGCGMAPDAVEEETGELANAPKPLTMKDLLDLVDTGHTQTAPNRITNNQGDNPLITAEDQLAEQLAKDWKKQKIQNVFEGFNAKNAQRAIAEGRDEYWEGSTRFVIERDQEAYKVFPVLENEVRRDLPIFALRGEPVMEEHLSDSPVASTLARAVMTNRTDLLQKYGLDSVISAINQVAEYVGDVEEIGSSDRNAFIGYLEDTLKNEYPAEVSHDAAAPREKSEIERLGIVRDQMDEERKDDDLGPGWVGKKIRHSKSNRVIGEVHEDEDGNGWISVHYATDLEYGHDEMEDAIEQVHRDHNEYVTRKFSKLNKKTGRWEQGKVPESLLTQPEHINESENPTATAKFTDKDVQKVIKLNKKHNFFTVKDGGIRWARMLNQDVKMLNSVLSKPIASSEDLVQLKNLVRKATDKANIFEQSQGIKFKGKMVNTDSLEADSDGLSSGEYTDGTPMSDEDLADFAYENRELVASMKYDQSAGEEYDARSSRIEMEDVEQVDELKKSTIASYLKKAVDRHATNASDIGRVAKKKYPDIVQLALFSAERPSFYGTEKRNMTVFTRGGKVDFIVYNPETRIVEDASAILSVDPWKGEKPGKIAREISNLVANGNSDQALALFRKYTTHWKTVKMKLTGKKDEFDKKMHQLGTRGKGIGRAVDRLFGKDASTMEEVERIDESPRGVTRSGSRTSTFTVNNPSYNHGVDDPSLEEIQVKATWSFSPGQKQTRDQPEYDEEFEIESIVDAKTGKEIDDSNNEIHDQIMDEITDTHYQGGWDNDEERNQSFQRDEGVADSASTMEDWITEPGQDRDRPAHLRKREHEAGLPSDHVSKKFRVPGDPNVPAAQRKRKPSDELGDIVKLSGIRRRD